MEKNIKLMSYALLGIIVASCGSKEEQKEEAVRPVMYQEVTPSGGFQERVFSGTSKSGTETKLSFQVAGNVSSLNAKVGQQVTKGQIIARLDNADFQLQYEQADASVKNADAQEKQAKSNFERIRALYENGSTSLSEYESAKANYESAKANESSAKKSRKLDQAQLNYTKLYSPVDGKIATVDVEVNENISVGQQVILLDSEGDLEVSLGIPESFISNINVQDEVSISFASLEEQVFKGAVSEVSFAISSQTSTYPVVIRVEGDTKAIRPGMAASVTFKIGNQSVTNDDKLFVATQAVGEDGQGNFVFVLEKEDQYYFAKKRPVTIGKLSSTGFEITDGLEEGELVATAGLQTLLDGMKVKLFEN